MPSHTQSANLPNSLLVLRPTGREQVTAQTLLRAESKRLWVDAHPLPFALGEIMSKGEMSLLVTVLIRCYDRGW